MNPCRLPKVKVKKKRGIRKGEKPAELEEKELTTSAGVDKVGEVASRGEEREGNKMCDAIDALIYHPKRLVSKHQYMR